MTGTIDIDLIDDPDGAVPDRVVALLDAHAVGLGHQFNPVPLALTATDTETGTAPRVVGGLTGATNMGWLFVKYLAVDPSCRRTGVGARLLGRAEAVARERGCVAAWLDTFSFQAPEFYRRQGYAEFGRLDGFPAGEARIFFTKRLDAADRQDGVPG